jgi:hypothetical protein
MVRYRRLDAWAIRDQRRFDNPPVPGTEPPGLRILHAFFSVLVVVAKCLIVPFFVVWVVVLAAQHTAQSLALAVVVAVLGGISAFTTGAMIHSRREHGVNWLTGLATKPRSN